MIEGYKKGSLIYGGKTCKQYYVVIDSEGDRYVLCETLREYISNQRFRNKYYISILDTVPVAESVSTVNLLKIL
jgi:hypothetical protein